MPTSAQQKVTDPKLAALLELERRGELPDDLKPQLDMYRQQGIAKPLSTEPPPTPADGAFSNDQVIAQIDKARDLATNHWTTAGWDALSSIPGTHAHDLSSTIGVIRANLALDALAKMRASSPTGGALGNVTEGEERLLADKAGALNQSDSQGNFLDNLTAVQQSYGRLALKYQGVDPDSQRGQAMLGSLSGSPSVTPPPPGGSPPSAPPAAGPLPGGTPPPPPPTGGTGGPVPGNPAPGGQPLPAAAPVGTGEQGAQYGALSSDGSATYPTAADKQFAADANAVLRRPGSTRADLDAVAAKYGRAPFGPDLDRVITYRNNGGKFATIGTPATGYSPPTTLGKVAASPVGAVPIGVANGLTAGHLADIEGALNNDPGAAAKVDSASAANPKLSLAGDVAGGVGAGLLTDGALAAAGVPAAVGSAAVPIRALLGDAVYGGATGHDPQSIATGAALGIGGGLLGRKAGGLLSPSPGKLAPLYDAGVRPTLGQRFADSGRVGAAVNAVEEASQSLPVLGMLPRAARQDARDQFERGAFNSALGELHGIPGVESRLPDDMELGTAPHAFMQDQFDKAYDQARSGMTFVPDRPYLADLKGYIGNLKNGVLNDGQVQQVRAILNNSVQSRIAAGGGQLTGDAYKAASSEISSAARKLSASEPLVSDALRDYGTIFDDAARRNSTPEAVDMLDKADAGYAKAVRVETAAAQRGGDTGRFSPTQFDAAVQKATGGVRSRAYLRGDALMGDYAEAGKSLTDRLPNSGTSDRLMTGELLKGQALTATPLGLLGYSHPAGALLTGAVTAPYAPGVQRLTRGLLAPRTGKTVRTLGDVLRQRGGLAGAPLGIAGGQALGLLSAGGQ